MGGLVPGDRPGAGAAPPAAGRRRSSPFVGRDRDLRRLVSVVSASPAVVTVEGEAGIGKTRLVSELASHPALADRRVVLGACRPIREPFPLGPFVEALRDTGQVLAGRDLSPVAGALRPLLPELARVLPPLPEPLDDRAAQRHRVFRGLVEALAALGPAVVVVEDAHWADEQTVEFLSYLLSTPPADLSLIVTFRGIEVPRRVRAAISRVPASVGSARLVLAPLDVAETGALAAAVLGAEPVSEEFAGYLCQRASGLPLAIHELLALLKARGALVRRGGRWARRIIDELDVPAGIREPVLERVTRLGAGARAVVEAAAVLQMPVPAAEVLAVAGAGTSDGLVEALASGLLEESADAAVAFRHVLAAQAVYEDIPPPRRRELHARAAVQARARSPVPAGQVAYHLRAAGRLAGWVEAAETAADQAVALGDDAEAARLLVDVLRHARLDTVQRGRLAAKLARAAMDSLRQEPDVMRVLSGVLREDLPPDVRGELRFTLGVLYEYVDPARQRRLFLEALDDLDGRPDLKAWTMVGLGLPRASGVDTAEHRAWLYRALDVLPEVRDPTFETLLRGKVAMVLTPLGDPHWRRVTDHVVRQTGGAPRHPREVNAYLSVALDACFAGHHAMARRLLDSARDGVVACSNELLKLRFRTAAGWIDFCQGEWTGLPERVDQLVAETEADQDAMEANVLAGCLALAGGEVGVAEQRLTEAVATAERRLNFDLLPIPLAALARLVAARNSPATSLADLDRLAEVCAEKGVWATAARALPPLTQVFVTTGQPGRAEALVAGYEAAVRGLDVPLAPAATAHARGALDAAAARWPAAAGRFLAAAERYDALWCPYEAAQAREAAAACLFAAGDPRAEECLRAAIGIFDRVGARWDLDRAARLARQHHMSVPARHRGGPRGYGPALSPREREVADLAATGRTNREIAAELYLSPKTVDKHLSAALRKLGLHSRTALARLVHDGVVPRGSADGEFSP